jgi:mannose-6-phosphate isomerase-like protein (cupin superfamily)
MEARTARFEALESWTVQTDGRVPLEARDLIYARRLLNVAMPEGVQGPFANPASIVGTDFTLAIAICPPGQGPGLHAHHKTTETFTCLQGRFRVYWGDEGEHQVILDRYDTVSVPPSVTRGFQNVGDDEGMLQVLITGGVSDMNDIALRPSVAQELEALSPGVLEILSETGLRFDAGVEAG